MKKLPKIVLTCAAVLVTAVVLVLVGVNLYLQSPGTQARIQEGLSDALRVPVRFVTTSLSLAGQLKITGISVPDGERTFLEASSFSARYRLRSLLRGRLEIFEMYVERPKIVWRQDAEGDWRVPKMAKAPEPAVKVAQAEPPPRERKEGGRRGLEVIVEGFQIRDGSVELIDNEGNMAASFHGVNVIYDTLSAERMAGKVHIARVAWREMLVFENVRTPFSSVGQKVALPQLTGTLAGGAVTGHFQLQLDGKKKPFALGLAFRDVDAGPLSTQIHSALGTASGAISGDLELAGSAREIARAEGAGKLQIRDGRFQKLELFEVIGEVLQIRELADLKLKDGRIVFRIADEKAHIEELALESEELHLGAKGIIRFDGKIQLASHLSIDDSLRKHLPGLIRGNFEQDERGRYAINFDVKGKKFRAETNLLDRLVGNKIKTQVEDLVSSLFGSKKKEEKKKDDKKKDDEKKSDEKKSDEKKEGDKPQPAPVAVEGNR